MARYIVAMTGASGAVYGKRLVEELLRSDHDVVVLVSKPGRGLLKHELDFELDDRKPVQSLRKWLGLDSNDERLTFYREDDLMAAVSSGSYKIAGMVIAPCSMSTAGAIASGATTNLIHRAADVSLKERRPLVLVPRETPLSQIHLRNLLEVAKAGGVVLPAMPGFYHRPQDVDGLVDFVVGKVLDVLGLENNLYPRWQGFGGPAAQ